MRIPQVLVNWGILLLFLFSVAGAQTQTQASDLPLFYDTLPFALTSPSAYPSAIGGFINPGAYGALPINGDIQYVWKAPEQGFFDIREWGLFIASRQFGFGLVRKQVPSTEPGSDALVNDARIAMAASMLGTSLGIAYAWISGDDGAATADVQFIQLGFTREFRRLGFGMAGKFSLDDFQDRSAMVDIALRPFDSSFLALFVDSELPFGVSLPDAPWSAGFRIEAGPGISLTGRYYDDRRLSAALNISFGNGWRVGLNQFLDKEGQPGLSTYEIRWGFKERSLLDKKPEEPEAEPATDELDEVREG